MTYLEEYEARDQKWLSPKEPGYSKTIDQLILRLIKIREELRKIR